MNAIIEKLVMYFQFPFTRYALIVGVLIALSSSFLGVTLVLKRFSFIGDGLSHVAFGAMCISSVLGIKGDLLFVLPFTVLSAIFLMGGPLRKIIRGDAAVAMVSVSSLAIGYLIMNLFPVTSNISGDVCTTLFGSVSILTLKKSEVKLCIILCLIICFLWVVFYNKIFSVTFDEDFARASGVNARLLNLSMAVLIAVVVVVSMKLVGSLLISALVVFPALSAMRLFKSYFSVTVCSAVVSVFSAATGIVVSILAGTPVGSTIVAVNIAVFVLFSSVSLIKG